MITLIVIPQADIAPAASLERTLLDGASLYGIAAFDAGLFRFAWKMAESEGLTVPYGQGSPAWGDFEMFTDGVVGVDYAEQWDLTGAAQPTTYEVLTGALPDGLSLDSPSGNVGTISGVPTDAGSFNFTLRATNEFGSADKAFSIVIVAAGGGGSFTFIG